jgi:hypothetical protein
VSRAFTTTIASLALAAACGGARSDINDPGTGGIDTSSDGGPLNACAPAGVRLCGAGCPELLEADAANEVDVANVCPGYGCLRADSTTDFTPSAAGVCWADATADARYACGECPDGDVCLQKSTSELVCVPEDVCRALWLLGVRDVCRYADFAPYDDRPVPQSTSTCPLPPSPHLLCGGQCGNCDVGVQCVGRSPDHPFGVCRNIDIHLPTPQPSDFMSCDECLASTPQYATWACAVFDGSAPLSTREQGGFCLELGDCLAVGGSIPGGASCYDASHHRLGP